jgi:hypothetical protein
MLEQFALEHDGVRADAGGERQSEVLAGEVPRNAS